MNATHSSTDMPAADGQTKPARPRLVLISAVARNGVIGRDDALPWRLPEDLAFFKKTTLGHPVLMGRATHESIGRPLPGRLNLVLTRDAQWTPAQTATTKPATAVPPSGPAAGATAASATALQVCHTLGQAYAHVTAGTSLFVIGGAQIYASLLAEADSLILTEINADFEGDACFPDWDRTAFTEVWRESHHKAAQDGQPAFDYAFVRYDRITQTTGG